MTAFSDIQGRATFTPAVGRVNGDRVFRAARRHSRRVRTLRIAIPAAVVAVVLGGFAFSVVIKPLRYLSKLPVDLSSLVVSGTKIMMQQPRLAGFTRDNRRYNLTAQAAGQDVTKPDLVELHGIHVNGGHRSAGADPSSQIEGNVAGAAADVQAIGTSRHVDRVEQRVGARLQRAGQNL